MAEYCKDCASRILGLNVSRAVMSKEPELCEGCGEYKPIVERINASIPFDTISAWLERKSRDENFKKIQKGP